MEAVSKKQEALRSGVMCGTARQAGMDTGTWTKSQVTNMLQISKQMQCHGTY